MDAPQTAEAPDTRLPLPLEAIPEELRRFVDPAASVPSRNLAARGLLPLKPAELTTVLLQLAHEGDSEIAQTARKTLMSLPEAVLGPACEGEMHPALLTGLAELLGARPGVLERIVSNPSTADATIAEIARTAPEDVCEIIATNQRRFLRAPAVIEALYKNKDARMSTVDRVLELAARQGLELPSIPSYAEHVKALENTLIAEPAAGPLPSDTAFAQALLEDDEDLTAIEQDPAEGTEIIKERYKPLRQKIAEMTTSEKLRLSYVGNAAARAILVRDPNRVVALAAIAAPGVTEMEAAAIAESREVAEEVLRFIGHRRLWLRSYEVKRALVFNPKTPVGVSLQFVGHMIEADLRTLGRSRNVAAAIKRAALQRMNLRGR